MIDSSDTLTLGSLDVHRLGFGTMQLTGPGVWGPPSDHEGAIAVLRRAVELGVDLLDTADSYGPNVAEELIFEALHPYSSTLKIATKAGFTRSGPGVWRECGDPEYLRRQCEGSLQRLGVDQIDLFQLHRVDKRVPAAEQFGLLKVSVAQIEAALEIVPIASVQNNYNIAHRAADDVVDFCEQHGIAFIPYFPLANGKFSSPGSPLDEIAAELGVTPSQVCLAWLLRRSSIMLPIPGTSSLAHLEENCAASTVKLSETQYQELSDAHTSLRRWVTGA
jgi:aryl-alcohol dehydrogenase-like predicted oxidoreductase